MGMRDLRDIFFLRGATGAWLAGGGAAALGLGVAGALAVTTVSSTLSAAGSAALAGAVALTVALPLLYICSRMARRVAFLRKEVQRLGQRDGLTACLNEPTFSALVDTYADRRAAGDGSSRGTVLLIHIDDLPVVNERFGYSWGNEALARVAAAIRETVRQGDIVGRVSGNQFGVFLPGADEENAKSVADRIYESVTGLDFFPSGVRYPLSIRAGAVILADRAKFDDLLKTAVSTLEMTKGPGEDWIRYTAMSGWPQAGAARLQ
jgi:diguanylate cyclase (GGDEF)-like protein